MKNKCIVSYFSQGREDYRTGCVRMLESLSNYGFNGDALIYSPDFTDEDINKYYNFVNGGEIIPIKGMPTTEKYGVCPPHSTHPYAFKAYCIQNALERGYKKIGWLDCSVVALHSIDILFELANYTGLITFDNQGCCENTWTSDDCFQQMGINPADATYFQIDAAMLFWDFNKEKAVQIFEEYMKYCNDGISLKGVSGSKRPEFNAHRHDQSILSALVRKYYLNPLNYGFWCTSADALTNKEYDPILAKIGIANSLNTIKECLEWKKNLI